MNRVVYLNSTFVPPEEATISVFDGGFLHGAGLFETMRAEGGKVFRLSSHLDRLRNSAATVLRPLERADLPEDAVFTELLERNKLKQARLRLTVTAGSMLPTPDAAEDAPPPLTTVITATELGGYTDKLYADGATVTICDYRQARSDPLAGHKTTAFFSRLMGLRAAQQANCLESLWFNVHNQLAEGSISNVFLIKDGALRTPPLDTPVLPGVARAAVLELAKGSGMNCTEAALTLDDLFAADEVFLTNVVMQIMPVVRIEKHDVGAGCVGPIVKRLRESFIDLVRQECRS